MKLATLLFVLLGFSALFFSAAFALAQEPGEDEDGAVAQSDGALDGSDEPYYSLHGVSRFLRDYGRPSSQTNCQKNPKICRKRGSPGRDCCKKKCVELRTDRLNCGRCGNKCRYSNICCRGKCVNQFYDRRNCGGCNRRCARGEYCEYGMCNYA